MEKDLTFKRVSPEGIAVDGAIDALTVEVCRGHLSAEEARRVADEILKTEVGVKAAAEFNAAVDETLKNT
jgi:polyhydroxyalkanoate synthesis regulator phasin